MDKKIFQLVFKKNKNKKFKIYNSFDDYNKIFKKKIDYTMSAISGLSGFIPTLNIIKYTKIIEAPININDKDDEIKRIMAEDRIPRCLNIIEKIKSQTFKNSVMKECRELFYQSHMVNL